MVGSEFPRAPRRRTLDRAKRRLVVALSTACFGLGAVVSCSSGGNSGSGAGAGDNGSSSGNSSGGNGGNGSSSNNSSGNNSGGNGSSSNNSSGNNSGGNGSSSNNSSGNNSGGNGSSSNNSSGNNSGGNGSSSNNSSGNGGNSGGNGGNSGGNGGNSGGSGGTSGGSGGNSGGNGSGSGNISDAGSGGSAEAGGGCTNTNMSAINIDSSGLICNNQWDITGAWYCFTDGTGTSSCTGTGDIPYKTASSAMCNSGATPAVMPSKTAYGSGLGFELNHVNPDAGPKSNYNATSKQIIGFALTISGDTGGAVLNVDFPTATTTGEAPGVAIPGVSSGSSPMVYNVLFSDAVVSDNNTTPIPMVVDATSISDVQVNIGVDGIAHTYNYCITKVVPIMAAPAAPGSLTAYGPTFNAGKQIVLTGLGPYGVQNDPFNVGSDQMTMQVSYGGGQVAFTANPNFTSGGTTPGAFPSVAYGWIHGGNFVGGKNAGAYTAAKTIGSLSSVTSSWSFTMGSGNGDAAYDCWLGDNSDSINPGSELMVWLGHNGVNPIGGQNTAITISGATGSWTYSTGTNGTGQPVVSYVSSTTMSNVSNFDLLPFMKEAASSGRAGLSTGSYLLGCQAGFELYSPGTWKTNSYSISAQ